MVPGRWIKGRVEKLAEWVSELLALAAKTILINWYVYYEWYDDDKDRKDSNVQTILCFSVSLIGSVGM